jgi:flagellar hook-basal body complex protein FliE
MTTPIRPDAPIASVLQQAINNPLGEPTDGANFSDLLTRAVGNVQQSQERKDDVIGAFLAGKPVELHDVMAAAEEASLSLSLLVETRNKLTDAYRTVMNIQV